MNGDIAIILIVACLAAFVWVPAIVWSVRKTMHQDNENMQ